MRYDPNGSPDATFGTAGQVTLGNFSSYTGFNNIALQPDGKILIATIEPGTGYPQSNTGQPQLVRLYTDGSTDTSFGDDGVVSVMLPHPSPYDGFSSIAVQPLGRIVAETASSELLGIIGDPVVAFGGATSISSSSGTPTAVYDVSETAGTATITLERGGDLSQTLAVPFSTDDSGGHAGVNYTSVNTIVSFAAGSATVTVAIPILDDPNASAPIDVPLRLGTPTAGAILGNVAVGDLHIDPVEGIVITPTQLSSVMQGGAAAAFTVVLKSVPTANVTVPLAISTTSPTAVLSANTLVFTPANSLTPQTVTVSAVGSSGSPGPAQTAMVTAGPATSTDPKYNGLAGGSATVGVYAAATSPGSLEFAAANFTVNENAGTAKITLVRLGGSAGSVSVHFATSDGSSESAGKYVPLSGSISFGPGVTTRQFAITLINPGHNLQGDQTVDLTLSNPSGGAGLGVFPAATLTLHDTSQLSPGDLDPSFGTAGRDILPLAPNVPAPAEILRQADGKLVIVGLTGLWRTDASGQPDASFGQNGFAAMSFQGVNQIVGAAIGPDGKIVILGRIPGTSGATNTPDNFALTRINADGTLDTFVWRSGGNYRELHDGRRIRQRPGRRIGRKHPRPRHHPNGEWLIVVDVPDPLRARWQPRYRLWHRRRSRPPYRASGPSARSTSSPMASGCSW